LAFSSQADKKITRISGISQTFTGIPGPVILTKYLTMENRQNRYGQDKFQK